jgi:sporulation protein YlmC with PRC-barrel domain
VASTERVGVSGGGDDTRSVLRLGRGGARAVSYGGAVAEETEFAMGAEASCADGPGGKVTRVIIDPATGTVTHLVIEPKNWLGAAGRLVPLDHRVTHVLLQEGHLWGRREVAIPASAVTKVENGIWLNLTKEQVEDLPPAGNG